MRRSYGRLPPAGHEAEVICMHGEDRGGAEGWVEARWWNRKAVGASRRHGKSVARRLENDVF